MSFGGRVVVLSKDNTNVVGKRHRYYEFKTREKLLNNQLRADCSVCISIIFITHLHHTQGATKAQ